MSKELPPLPSPSRTVVLPEDVGNDLCLFTADQVLAYARESLALRSDGAMYYAASRASSPEWHAGFKAGLEAGKACGAASASIGPLGMSTTCPYCEQRFTALTVLEQG
jgi:hypothetical protein